MIFLLFVFLMNKKNIKKILIERFFFTKLRIEACQKFLNILEYSNKKDSNFYELI